MKLSIRTIYLYLFALVGLILIIIGTVRLVDLGLKVFIFTKAYQDYPSVAPFPPEKALLRERGIPSEDKTENIVVKKDIVLSAEEKELLLQWEGDYLVWQEKQKTYDPKVANQQRTAANSIAMLLIGLPLFLYHWRVIQREKAGT